MDWVQVYDPLGSPLWSTVLAALPIIALLGLLAGGLDAPKSALAGLITALGVAVFGFGMPVGAAVASAGYGACFGLLPIGWIVVAAVFLFHLTVKSGHIEIVKRSVAALSPDRRVQALLIAFCFGTSSGGRGLACDWRCLFRSLQSSAPSNAGGHSGQVLNSGYISSTIGGVGVC